MPQDADAACDLSTPEVLFQSLPPAEPNIHTISFPREEGRLAYDNIRKVIFLLVSTGLAELVLVGLA